MFDASIATPIGLLHFGIYPNIEAFFAGDGLFVIRLRAGLAECQKLSSFFKGLVLCDEEMSPKLLF
jgi:hypothetical protein